MAVCFQRATWSAVLSLNTFSKWRLVLVQWLPARKTASENPINIAKGRGADLKEAEKAEIARTRKVIIVNTNANMTVIKFVDIFKYCFVFNITEC